ncbi:Rossmann fold nucleotide-binding protein Smf possibly involved in DNA uptake [hydrothermal vent metagenome]|uniref:Rossmann fold nucleotide-binding protein Smf possibly involved in DNA uptake n=1 Tax=hydrothermal vent metagenome TaxID=652676 RepID=A0A3B0WBE6_9ZZZZ
MSIFSDLPSLLALHISHIPLKQALELQAHFGSLKSALQGAQKALAETQILKTNQLDRLFDQTTLLQVEQAMTWGEQAEQNWLPFGSEHYPDLLQTIDDAPLLLATRGQVTLLQDPQLAIVGSRHASKQGLMIAKDFAQHLSSQGLGITSGLALGIDAAAHQGGLQGIGKTIAVVATGLDRIYPAANQTLGRQIAEEGVMVSEFPLGTKPLAYHFPKRNRIISGLSVGTLVVEAALKSGSLITAKTAMNQGREVFAVPGSINNPQAKGCHQLIKQGAKLVESGQDILEELSALLQHSLTPQTQLKLTEKNATPALSPSHQPAILEHIGYDPIGMDELIVLSKSPVYDIQSQLMLLELSGQVEKLSAGRWRRLN